VLIGGLLVLAAALGPFAVGGPSPPGPVTLHWWELIPLFALAEVLVVHVEVSRDAHTFTLSELPVVLALLFAPPADLLVARVVGEVIVLLVLERQWGIKLALNVSLFCAETCLALATFRVLGGVAGRVDAPGWTAALVAVCLYSALSVLVVGLVISWHGGSSDRRSLLLIATGTALGNASLAGLASVFLDRDRWAFLPLAILVAVVVLGYRSYTRLSRRYVGLDALYTFTSQTVGVTSTAQAMDVILHSARQVLQATTAAIALRPERPDVAWPWAAVTDALGCDRLPVQVSDRLAAGRRAVVLRADGSDAPLHQALQLLGVRDAVVAPLVDRGGVVGALLLADRVADRVGESGGFGAQDARLLTALTAQAVVALEKGRLIQELSDQVGAREHEALHDSLTGLPNRAMFGRELAVALDRAGDRAGGHAADHGPGGGRQIAVLLMDLDQFKEVNDTLGHHTGDLLLQQIAQRLRESVPAHALVARLGGDEFAVLLPGCDGPDPALRLARHLHDRATEPIGLAGLRLEVGASIGVALHPEHGTDGELLLQRADVAMYAAKEARAQTTLYDPRADWSSPLRLRLATDLRAALAGDGLSVCYQPISRAEDLRVVAVEALCRWQHPELGPLSPEQFIPVAERAGLIRPLTQTVLTRSLRQLVAWREVGVNPRLAVNLSVQILLDTDWPTTALGLLREHGVAPDRLTFEITETGIMSDPQSMISALRELSGHGVRFAVDDFGTGYSSLAYLQQLPVSELKIDKSFVLSLAADPSAATIARSVVDLARNLHLDTVAEGVEDQSALEQLRRMRCDCIQGFHVAPPMPGAHLPGWLAARRPTSGVAPPAIPGQAPGTDRPCAS